MAANTALMRIWSLVESSTVFLSSGLPGGRARVQRDREDVVRGMRSEVELHYREGVSDLLISCQTGTPNSYRLINSPMTKSCMRSVLEKQIVRRTSRLIRVHKLMCLLSIFWVFAFPTVCCSASTCRS